MTLQNAIKVYSLVVWLILVVCLSMLLLFQTILRVLNHKDYNRSDIHIFHVLLGSTRAH